MFGRRQLPTLCALFAASFAVGTPAGAHISRLNKISRPVFDPETFFQGHTEGIGRLKIILRPRRLVHARGVGRIDQTGALILDQDIEQAGEPLKHRRWVMRHLSGGNYAATLSDAAGPVTGRVEGNTLRLAFHAKGGLRVRQSLVLSPDGRSARNRLTIRKMGIVVATLNETITRVD